MKSINDFIGKYFPYYLDSYNSENKLFTKWDWDYNEYLIFLSQCLPFLRENPQLGFSIACSHPHCFTNGSGLQKEKGKILDGLIAFDDQIKLPFALHQIKRGGGLTFHYPGQFIYYPLFHMNRLKSSPPRIMIKMLIIAKEILEKKFLIEDLDYQKLLGLWYKSNTKIASTGMGLEYYVSTHGMAFNFHHDQLMFETLQKIHPCGIQGETYSSLEKIFSGPINKSEFTNNFHDVFSNWVNQRN